MKASLYVLSARISPALVLALGVCVARAQAPSTTRVNVATGGAEANWGGGAPSVSADGRFVAFMSGATNLVSGDTNAFNDMFVRDRISGITERVSVSSSGEQATDHCNPGAISADGRCVTFWSAAPNLVAGDTNLTFDVFLRDRATGVTERVSIDSAGLGANSDSSMPAISADGRFVAFASGATNLAPNDLTWFSDVYLRDRVHQTIELVSVAISGSAGDDSSGWPAISADGTRVAFMSYATDLVAIDTNGVADVFVRDLTAGVTRRVSLSTGGAECNADASRPCISADGRFVAFESYATNLVAGDANLRLDVFVHDCASGVTELASVSSTGAQGNYDSRSAACSADGRFVAFNSQSVNLAPGDVLLWTDVFVRDRLSGTTERVSVSSAGVPGDSHSAWAAISADGQVVAFHSYAANLVPGDTNNTQDVFVRDANPSPIVVTYCTAGTSSSGCNSNIAAIANPSITLEHGCVLTVAGVEGQVQGLVFYGLDNSGFTPTPWTGGSTSVMCVKQPLQRTPLQNSGGAPYTCNGSFALDWNAFQSANSQALGNPWSVGSKVYAQAWFHDPFDTSWTNLSNAVEMTYLP
jgi:Tol biopolymer transport system component